MAKISKKTKNPTPLADAFEPAPINQNDHEALRRYVANRLLYTIGKDPKTATKTDWYQALARLARDKQIENWIETTRQQYEGKVKRVYYLSMEFLIGRALTNSLMSMDLYDELATALAEGGVDLEESP